jgi:hypothetical protein
MLTELGLDHTKYGFAERQHLVLIGKLGKLEIDFGKDIGVSAKDSYSKDYLEDLL